ncbi:J domain-containing protein [Vampirovibrio sp.]|uniref:J domain-containing protein n=1 Tax=Vampirovibrio sp. TaxID=2717857 RepID=UPI003593480A
MMTRPAFFNEYPLPVFAYLSTDTKRQLESYLQTGNSDFRHKKLLEFFKSIDWLDAAGLAHDRLLQKLSASLQRQLFREIDDYRREKMSNRVESAEKREQYKLRVFEYFRAKIPASDKTLLENLRDYELDLTGRDVNWRHYFTLDSFKKIDAFIQATHEERLAWFSKFRQDVETYKKNYDKIYNANYTAEAERGFTFDDWCDMMGDEAPGVKQSRQKQAGKPHASKPGTLVEQAYQTLEMPVGASPEQVKKQFRQMTLRHHPDLPSGSEEKMKALVGAYQQLQRYWATVSVAL